LRQPRNGHRSVDRILSLARREAEVAIRWARPERGELVACRIVDVPYALYRARDLPLRAEDRQVLLIGLSVADGRLPDAQWLTRAFPDRAPAIRATGLQARISLVRGGAGLGVLPRFVQRVFRDIEAVEAPIAPLVRSLWLVVHRDLRRRPVIAVVNDFLHDIIGEALRGGGGQSEANLPRKFQGRSVRDAVDRTICDDPRPL
jgi:DNA-binding transcriptional LysR family regulator